MHSNFGGRNGRLEIGRWGAHTLPKPPENYSQSTYIFWILHSATKWLKVGGVKMKEIIDLFDRTEDKISLQKSCFASSQRNLVAIQCNNRFDESKVGCKFAQSTRRYTTYPTDSIPLTRNGCWKWIEQHAASSHLIRPIIPAKHIKVFIFFYLFAKSFTFSPPYICVSGLYASLTWGSALQAIPASSQAPVQDWRLVRLHNSP